MSGKISGELERKAQWMRGDQEMVGLTGEWRGRGGGGAGEGGGGWGGGTVHKKEKKRWTGKEGKGRQEGERGHAERCMRTQEENIERGGATVCVYESIKRV